MPQSTEIIAAINAVIGHAEKPISLHEPLFSGNEKKYVSSCIDDGWVSSVGAFVDKFEQDLAVFCGAKYACVVVNGTAALQMALIVSGLQPDEEVLIPSLTFVATANAVVHAGGVPHFVDVEETSMGIDPDALSAYLKSIATTKNGVTTNKKNGRRIRALMPVHVFGHPCQLDVLANLAKEYGLAFIEDATEALGSEYHGRKIGSEHLSVLSFNGNKIITTGGGGAILTNDEAIYKKLKHLTTTAKQPHRWAFIHDEVAWNYRLPNLNAALGCAQLEQMPAFLAAKRALAVKYIAVFSSMKDVQIIAEPSGTKSNYWLVSLRNHKTTSGWLDETLAALHDAKILCRPLWTPLHQLPMYKDMPRADLRCTEALAQSVINLPSSVKLGQGLL
ncbi:MAG: LegC family aminotransferase [Alphaproteobacteria bacterium]